jgi:hypothetical protein
VKHLLKERKGRDVVAKCLATPTIEETTAWWTDVTCEDCLMLMSPPRPTRKLVRKTRA